MEYFKVNSNGELAELVSVLNQSHATVAKQFGFSKKDNPSNNAFITANMLKKQLANGIDLYGLKINQQTVGCVAIEKAVKEPGTFYIEKLSVLPEYRERGYGESLMDYATEIIKENEGKRISVALINSHTKLKCWYKSLGFVETGVKDFSHLPFQVCFMEKLID